MGRLAHTFDWTCSNAITYYNICSALTINTFMKPLEIFQLEFQTAFQLFMIRPRPNANRFKLNMYYEL